MTKGIRQRGAFPIRLKCTVTLNSNFQCYLNQPAIVLEPIVLQNKQTKKTTILFVFLKNALWVTIGNFAVKNTEIWKVYKSPSNGKMIEQKVARH